MAATQKYQLIVEAQARGEEELLRLERALTRVDDVTKKARNTTLEIAGSIAAITAAFKAATASAGAFVSANIATEASMQRTLNTYRALRLAIAAPGGAASIGLAAGTIAGGYALQKIIETTVERARQVQGASFSAASTGSSFQSAYTLQRAGAVTGRDLGFLSGYSAADISAVTLKLRGIEDPILRASEAIRIFGKDGKTALETLDGRLAAATARAADLAEELDGPTRNSLNEFKSAFDNFHPFKVLGDEFDDFAERFKIGVAKVAVGTIKYINENGPKQLYFSPEGNAETAGIQTGPPVPSDAAFIRGGRADAAEALKRLATPGANLGGTGLASAFRAGGGGTEGSIQLRLELIGKERSKLRALLSSDGLADTTFKDIAARLGRIDAEEKELQRFLKLNKPELVADPSTFVTPLNTRVPSLRGRNSSLPNLPEFISTQADRNAFDSSNPGADQQATRAELERQKAQRERELNTSFARQFVSFEERRIELLTGPGGELAAIQKIYDLKQAGLEQEIALGSDIFNLNERRYQIEEERTLRLLELERRRKQEAAGLASDFVGSLQSGRPQDFFKQTGGRLLNGIGTNALTGTFQKIQGSLGSFGASLGLGGLLKGTILDPSNANTPVDKNTIATDRNTAAIEAATGRTVGGVSIPGAGVGLPSGFNSMAALGPVSGFTSGFKSLSTTIGQVGTGLSSVIVPGGLFAGLNGGSIQQGNGRATTQAGLGIDSTAGRVANVTGSVAAIGIGAVEAYRGFKQGGATGILQGSAAALGTAALIPGPQQPFIAAAAATAALIGMLLPDPKKARDAAINRELQNAYYAETAPMTYDMDRLGRSYDTNKRGDMRSVPVTININALDSKSITDNRESIADAVRMAVWEGHGINRAMQEAVLAV